MKKYEILEHRADLKIRVFGKTKKELFKNALLGMTNSLLGNLSNKNLNTYYSEKLFIHSGSEGGLVFNISLHFSSVNLSSIGCLNS